jgi:hypothetical protein
VHCWTEIKWLCFFFLIFKMIYSYCISEATVVCDAYYFVYSTSFWNKYMMVIHRFLHLQKLVVTHCADHHWHSHSHHENFYVTCKSAIVETLPYASSSNHNVPEGDFNSKTQYFMFAYCSTEIFETDKSTINRNKQINNNHNKA